MSPNEKILAVTNLYDGIDWYSLISNHFMDASYQHTTTHTTLKMLSFPLPSFMVTVQCCRAHPMDVLVSPMLRIGRWWRNFDMTVSSSISYIETVTDSSFISRRYCTSLGALLYRNVLVTLIILVVQAYSSMGDARQIVTGVADKGAETVIRYWIQQSGVKRSTKSTSFLVGTRGWAFLVANVRTKMT